MCYNDPPFEDFSNKSAMNCSKCPHPTCTNAIRSISVAVCECEGMLYFDVINQGVRYSSFSINGEYCAIIAQCSIILRQRLN